MSAVHAIRLPARFDPDTLAAFRRAVEEAPRDGTLLVGGASEEVFCLGLGLDTLADVPPAEREAGLADFEAAILALVASPAPTVAAVRGRAIGGGLGVAAACDAVVASADAEFALPEPLFGLVPGMILPVLRTRASSAALRRLAVRGDAFGAEQARSEGLVDEVVAPERVDRAVERWARAFSRAERGAVGRLKGWLADMDRLEVEVGRGRRVLAELMGSEAFQARVARYRQGLAPWEVDDEGP